MAERRGPAREPGGGKAIGRALGYLRHYRGETAGAMVSLLLASAANLAAPQLVRLAVDTEVSFELRREEGWHPEVSAQGEPIPRRAFRVEGDMTVPVRVSRWGASEPITGP